MGAASGRTLAVDNADWMSDVKTESRASGARVHCFTLSPALVQRLQTEAIETHTLAEDDTAAPVKVSEVSHQPLQQLTPQGTQSSSQHPLTPDGHSPNAARNIDFPNSFVMVLPSRNKSNSSPPPPPTCSPRQAPSPRVRDTKSCHFINPGLSQRLPVPNLVRGDVDKEEGLYDLQPPGESQLRDQMEAHIREFGAVRARVQASRSGRSALQVHLGKSRAALEQCYSDNPQDALACSPYVRAFKDIADSPRLDRLRLPGRPARGVT